MPAWTTREFWLGSALTGSLAAAATLILAVGLPMIQRIKSPAPGTAAQTCRLELGGGTAVRTLGAKEFGGETRGPGSAADTVRVKFGQERVRIDLMPIPEVSPETMVELTLIDASGKPLHRATVQYDYLVEGTRGLMLASTGPLSPGDFVVQLDWTDASGTRRSAHFPVHLRH